MFQQFTESLRLVSLTEEEVPEEEALSVFGDYATDDHPRNYTSSNSSSGKRTPSTRSLQSQSAGGGDEESSISVLTYDPYLEKNALHHRSVSDRREMEDLHHQFKLLQSKQTLNQISMANLRKQHDAWEQTYKLEKQQWELERQDLMNQNSLLRKRLDAAAASETSNRTGATTAVDSNNDDAGELKTELNKALGKLNAAQSQLTLVEKSSSQHVSTLTEQLRDAEHLKLLQEQQFAAEKQKASQQHFEEIRHLELQLESSKEKYARLEDVLEEIQDLSRGNTSHQEAVYSIFAMDALKEQFDSMSKRKDELEFAYQERLAQRDTEIRRLQLRSEQQQDTIDRLRSLGETNGERTDVIYNDSGSIVSDDEGNDDDDALGIMSDLQTAEYPAPSLSRNHYRHARKSISKMTKDELRAFLAQR